MIWTAPGVVMPLAEYLADPAPHPSLSSRTADDLLERSARHAWWRHPRLNPAYQPETDEALERGSVAHQLVVEDRQDGVVVVHAKDWRTKEAQTARTTARAAGQIPMLAGDRAELTVMVGMWREQFQRLEPPPFRGGAPERTFIWPARTAPWQAVDVWCRTRPDYVHPGGADDLKTTSASAHPAEWARRRLWETGAYLQAALYHRAMRHLEREPGEFRFIVCEVTPPYGVSALALDPEALAHADAMLGHAIDRWRQCLATDTWPGYPTRTAYAELPAWLKVKATERAYYQDTH